MNTALLFFLFFYASDLREETWVLEVWGLCEGFVAPAPTENVITLEVRRNEFSPTVYKYVYISNPPNLKEELPRCTETSVLFTNFTRRWKK
jgi:hypothetical protein